MSSNIIPTHSTFPTTICNSPSMSSKKVLVACTGSVATIKLSLLLEKLANYNIHLKVIITERAKHFLDESFKSPPNVEILDDASEWNLSSNLRESKVLHIELGRWADLLVIAPLSANTMAKITNGICDSLLTCVVRAWDIQKPLLFCPAMNTRMYNHPITEQQLEILTSWGYYMVPSINKMLFCGETGIGAMAEIDTIVRHVITKLVAENDPLSKLVDAHQTH